MAELARAAEKAQAPGELLRLRVFVDEARNDYWNASAQDFDARNFMWGKAFDQPGKLIRDKLEHSRTVWDIDRLEPQGPTAETFFNFWGAQRQTGSPETLSANTALIDDAERRLGIAIGGQLRAAFTQDNGGYTDFCNYPRQPWAPLTLSPGAYQDNWFNPFHSGLIVSVQHWRSATDFLAEREANLVEVEAENKRWRDSQQGLDRLIAICASERKGNGAWTLFCLDYRNAPEPGAVVIAEAEPFGGPLEVLEQWPDFERFFQRLRRFEMLEIDGVVRWRNRVVEILDNGRWRAPRG